jgi:hypothetical protein
MIENIDWTQLVTQKIKDQVKAAQVLSTVIAESARRRTVADSAIAPLQDAVDVDDATVAEVALLKAWKKYRVALNRLPEQLGYPAAIEWPVEPV